MSVDAALDSASHDPGGGHTFRNLALFFALSNLLLWFVPPLLGEVVDNTTGRWMHTPRSRVYLRGVQELLVYFDPWLSRVVFPVVYTVGFAAIAFLIRPRLCQGRSQPGKLFLFNASLLLLFFEITWLYLIAVGVFFRDPDWNLAWPWHNWVPQEIRGVNRANLSDYFWHWIGRPDDTMFWAERELPGLVLVAIYFLAGPVIACILWHRGGRVIEYWRWLVLILLMEIAALVPIKIVLRWGFNLGYWIFLPEHSLSILSGHVGKVLAIAFCPRTKSMAMAGDGLRVRRADGTIIEFNGHGGSVLCLAFSADGQMLVSGGADGTVRLWNTADGTELHTYEGHADRVHAVTFARDDGTICSGSADGTLRRWTWPL